MIHNAVNSGFSQTWCGLWYHVGSVLCGMSTFFKTCPSPGKSMLHPLQQDIFFHVLHSQDNIHHSSWCLGKYTLCFLMGCNDCVTVFGFTAVYRPMYKNPAVTFPHLITNQSNFYRIKGFSAVLNSIAHRL